MAKTTNQGPPPSWHEPLTPEALVEYGQLDSPVPTADFDPRGNWIQRWQIYLLRKTTLEKPHAGHIEITRRVEGDRVRLSIRQANFQGTQLAKNPIEGHTCQDGVWLASVCDTRADVVCRNDMLLTPDSWTLNSAMRCTKGKDFSGTRMQKTMRIRDGRLETESYGKTSLRPLPMGEITSNWGLLNSLSVIHDNKVLTFTMLDELDKVKTGHRLNRVGEKQIEFGGRQVKVYCYHQIGRGCLPWEYYVDASTGRMLLAISGLRAYILDEMAAQKTLETFPGFEGEQS